MKEATGELNMTVVTVVAIAAIGAVFYLWVWPAIQVSIAKNTCRAACGQQNAGCNTRITIAEINAQGNNFDATAYCN